MKTNDGMNTSTIEKLTAHAELDSSPICAVSPVSAGWVRGDAPRDGKLYVALGRVVGSDEWGGRSTPFLSQVRWGGSGGWSGWVDERGMAISSDIDDLVYIDHWCDLPNVAGQTAAPKTENPTQAGSLLVSPRTDAEALWPASNDDSDTKDPSGAYVLADFARILESENRQMLALIESLVMQLEHVEWLRDHRNGLIPSTLTPEILSSAKRILANVKDQPRP